LTQRIIDTGKFPKLIQESGTATSVVVALNSALKENSEIHQNNLLLHRVLSKVYRIFVELMWFQCQLNGDGLTSSDTKQDIFVLTHKMASILGKNEIQSKFNYLCAQEAAKHLTPPNEDIIRKYTGNLFALAESLSEQSIFSFATAFLKLAQDIDQDWARDWYKDVHFMNWIIIPLKTVPSLDIAFVETILAINLGIKDLRTKNRQYTICLAHILTKFLLHPRADQEVRKKSLEQLAILLNLKEKGLRTKVLNAIKQHYTPQLIISIAENQDQYLKTRRFARQCLEKISRNPICQEYFPQIGIIKQQSIKPLKEIIIAQKSIMKTKNKDIQNQKINTAEQISIEENKPITRGGKSIDTEETIKKLKEDFEKKSAKEKRIKGEYKQLGILQNWITDIDTEESQYLQEILG